MVNTVVKYQKYAEYQDSGVEWLRKIPKEWKLLKAKYIFQKIQRESSADLGIVTAFRDGVVTLRSNRRTEGFTNSVYEIGYQGVEIGDLLIHSMDGFAGAIGVSDSQGKCSPVCSVCIPWSTKKIDVNYYGYLIRQLAVTGYITSLAKGIRERSTEFRYREFADLDLPLPPLIEQVTITKFIKYETAKIDNLIEKQQKLIELLQEKRQAVISHAVTKGLNPDGPMKDSGVEWLGKIPKYWNLKKLKYLCKVTTGSKDTVNAVEDGQYPFFVRSQKIERINSIGADCEAVLTAGDGAGVGKVYHYYNGKFDFHQRVYMLYEFGAVTGQFVYYYLSSNFYKVALEGNAKSTVDSLRLPQFLNFEFSVPTLEEQSLIVSFLDKEVAKIDSLVEKSEAVIQLMQERRTALISAAVTGKIDVRNWQAPDEAVRVHTV